MSFTFNTALACILIAVASAKSVSDCADSLPRDEFLQVFGDKCFYFHVNISTTFLEAQESCVGAGGNLAMAKTRAINKFLNIELSYTYFEQLAGHRKVWIGLHDMNQELSFQWVDNSTLTFTNFAKNQGPRHGLLSFGGLNEDCVAMDAKSGEWYDLGCDVRYLFTTARHPFVCEFKTN